MGTTRISVLGFLRRLEDDPASAEALRHGSALFQAALACGLVETRDEDAFAQAIGRLIGDGLVRFEWTNGGHRSLPDGGIWNAYELQSHGGYGLTADGLHATQERVDAASDEGATHSSSSTPPAANRRASVFISYAHEDKSLARAAAGVLDGAGCRVWIDEGDLLAGDSVIQAIAEAVGQTDYLVAILSGASIESEWCRKEISLALTSGLNEVRVKVIPVRVDGVAVPAALRDLLYIEIAMSDPNPGLGRLVRSVIGQSERQSPPATSPTPSSETREAQLAIDLERIDEWETEELQRVDSDHAARGVFHSSMRIHAREKVQREANRRRREAKLRAGDVAPGPTQP